MTAEAATREQSLSKPAHGWMGGNSVLLRALRRIRPHLGPVTIGTRNSSFSGPATLPLYDSYAYPLWSYYRSGSSSGNSFWGPSFYGNRTHPLDLSPRFGKGQVELQVDPRTAQVLINNVYAGTVASLKGSVWLKPGVYDLCVKAPGHLDFRRRISVLGGKKLEVTARLAPANPQKN
ncbi:MAG: PEGA domain-containing protein [Acidobacteriota bacterium]